MTSPASARVHTDGVIAQLAAAITTFDGEGPQDPASRVPYVVVRTDSGQTHGSLGDRYTDLTMLVWVTAVGGTREQAQWAADKARIALLDNAGPAVSGRLWHPMWQETSQPVQRDDAVSPALFYQVAAYRLHTQPEEGN